MSLDVGMNGMVWVGQAYAQNGGSSSTGPGLLATLVPLLLIFAIFYLLIIRPQSKRVKQHREMVNNLEEGNRVITGGGLYGRVVQVNEDVITLELAEGVRVKARRDSIQSVLAEESQKEQSSQGNQKGLPKGSKQTKSEKK